jgi:hypothetical protein
MQISIFLASLLSSGFSSVCVCVCVCVCVISKGGIFSVRVCWIPELCFQSSAPGHYSSNQENRIFPPLIHEGSEVRSWTMRSFLNPRISTSTFIVPLFLLKYLESRRTELSWKVPSTTMEPKEIVPSTMAMIVKLCSSYSSYNCGP